MKKDERAKVLWNKYLNGDANDQEKAELESWYIKEVSALEREEPEAVNKVAFDDGKMKSYIWTKIKNDPAYEERLKGKSEQLNSRKISLVKWPQIAIAASLLIAFSIGLYFYDFKDGQQNTINQNLIVNDKTPGGNRAILTLADGSTIDLSDDQNGIIIGDKDIRYNDGSSISPYVISTEVEKSVRMQASTLSLTTPSGGQYQITLPDGTKAWLNSNSTLIYPSGFSGKDRRVELTGEAYFEVAKNKKQPFIVASSNQEVKVLGTHFNINAYSDEGNTKTTLLEGSVSVSPYVISTAAENHEVLMNAKEKQALMNKSVRQTGNTPSLSSRGTKDLYEPSLTTILSPGEQSTVTGGNISTSAINSEDAIAWKNGYFMFDNENLESIMKKIARWYSLEIKFDDPSLKKETFFGTISKFENSSKVLNMLERTGVVRFEITGNTLTIKRKR